MQSHSLGFLKQIARITDSELMENVLMGTTLSMELLVTHAIAHEKLEVTI
jgi:hypothetical protein